MKIVQNRFFFIVIIVWMILPVDGQKVESRVHSSVWCMPATPLMADNDLLIMKKEILNILSNQKDIVIDQDSPGKQGHYFTNHPDKYIRKDTMPGNTSKNMVSDISPYDVIFVVN